MSEHVLFVDDDAAIRTALALCLEKRGMKVTTAASRDEAIGIIEKMHFSLVILDLNLANENGLDLLRRLKETHPNLPVIIFTSAGDDPELLTEALAAGANAFMSKGDSLEILIQEVEWTLQWAASH